MAELKFNLMGIGFRLDINFDYNNPQAPFYCVPSAQASLAIKNDILQSVNPMQKQQLQLVSELISNICKATTDAISSAKSSELSEFIEINADSLYEVMTAGVDPEESETFRKILPITKYRQIYRFLANIYYEQKATLEN